MEDELIVLGDIIEDEDGRELICMGTIEDGGLNYVYLATNTKPFEMQFASQRIDEEGDLVIDVVEEQSEIDRLLKIFTGRTDEQ